MVNSCFIPATVGLHYCLRANGLAFLLFAGLLSAADLPLVTRGDKMLAEYFRNETAALAEHCLADIHSREDWEARRGEYRREIQ